MHDRMSYVRVDNDDDDGGTLEQEPLVKDEGADQHSTSSKRSSGRVPARVPAVYITAPGSMLALSDPPDTAAFMPAISVPGTDGIPGLFIIIIISIRFVVVVDVDVDVDVVVRMIV